MYGGNSTPVIGSMSLDVGATIDGAPGAAGAELMDARTAIESMLKDDDRKHSTQVHAWEGAIDKTWDNLEEDSTGRLRVSTLEATRARKHRLDEQYEGTKEASGAVVEKGLIRSMILVVDKSVAMVDDENGRKSPLNPYGYMAVRDQLEQFIKLYFDQNPVSQMGVVVAHAGKAERVSDLSSNQDKQIMSLVKSEGEGGPFSLLNSLMVAGQKLIAASTHGTREVLVVQAALSSVDPSDIFHAITLLRSKGVRVSIIGLNAEVYVCKLAAERTGGRYTIVQNLSHLTQVLQSHVRPSSVPKSSKLASANPTRKWIRVGFPRKTMKETPSFCACHDKLSYEGYYCPRCKSKVCEMPSECPVCQLSLASSSHLARSYHHMFMPPAFTTVDIHAGASSSSPDMSMSSSSTLTSSASSSSTPSSSSSASSSPSSSTTVRSCASCLCSIDLDDSVASRCPVCLSLFCLDCDEFIHVRYAIGNVTMRFINVTFSFFVLFLARQFTLTLLHTFLFLLTCFSFFFFFSLPPLSLHTCPGCTSVSAQAQAMRMEQLKR